MCITMSEPIRVCQVVGNMVGGGVEHVVINYAKHVDHSRVVFDFIITENSTVIPREEMEADGGRVFFVPPYKNLLAFEGAIYELFKTHPEWKIVHSHMNALSVFPLKQAKNAGIPVRIAHSHSSFGHGEPVRNAAKTVLKHFANTCPTNRFACSKSAGDWLFGKGMPYEIVHNAIELDRFFFSAEARAQARADLGLFGGEFVVGHVGRFMKTKNQEFLLEVFARLLQLRPESILCFAGTGETEASVKSSAAELGIADRVRFLGQREDANRLYQAFDAFALPSLYEGLGLVGVEAQAAGLPCVLSDRITHEVDLTHTCDFVSIDSPQAWTDALASIAPHSDEERATVDREAFTDYDIDEQGAWLTNRYLELYEEAR